MVKALWTTRRTGERCDSFITRADAALYEAKTGGRNQVRLAA